MLTKNFYSLIKKSSKFSKLKLRKFGCVVIAVQERLQSNEEHKG